MSIGERIKARRQGQGLTQEELANRIGTIKQTVYKYERDIITNIPIERLNAIASALDTSVSYLLGITDDPDDASFATTAMELAFSEYQELRGVTVAEKKLLETIKQICQPSPDAPLTSESLAVVTDFIERNADLLRKSMPDASDEDLASYNRARRFMIDLKENEPTGKDD